MNNYFSKLLYILSDSKHQLVWLFLLFITASLLEAFGIGMIGPFLGVASNPEVIQQIQILNWMYAQTDLQSYQSFVPLLGSAIAVVFLLKTLIYFLSKVYIYRFSFDQKGKLCCKLLNTYLSVPYTFHLNRNTSSLINNVVVETERFGSSLLALLETVSSLIVIFFLLALLFQTSATLLILITLIIFPLIFLFLKLSKVFGEWGKGASEAQKEIIRIINHSLGGIKEVRVVGCELHFSEQMDQQVHLLEKFKVLYHVSLLVPRISIETCIVLAIVFFTSIYSLNQSGDGVVAVLGVFAVASIRLVPTVSQFLAGIGKLRGDSYAIHMLYLDLKALDQERELQKQDILLSLASKPKISKINLIEKKYNFHAASFLSQIDLKSLKYSYPGIATPAIDDVSLIIRKGESIALIGKSGAGKTTLVDIILGLLQPDQGDICVDNISIYQNLRAWQNLIGYIPQSIFLIDDTVEKNIAFGVPDALIDADRLRKAVQAAQLSELVAQLPNGIKTSVGERGIRLSGGQRQRIGIARALYHEREILVLDEATSALDNETENLVTESIKSLSGEKTMIIIAHRLSTVKHCNRIYSMDKGRIVKHGSYREVVLKN
jgi:ABC-type multidrug transport system fused ATPase/permease subunit